MLKTLLASSTHQAIAFSLWQQLLASYACFTFLSGGTRQSRSSSSLVSLKKEKLKSSLECFTMNRISTDGSMLLITSSLWQDDLLQSIRLCYWETFPSSKFSFCWCSPPSTSFTCLLRIHTRTKRPTGLRNSTSSAFYSAFMRLTCSSMKASSNSWRTQLDGFLWALLSSTFLLTLL